MELWQPQKENIPFDRFSVCLQLNKSADRICPGSIFSYITATVRCRNNPPEKLMITIAFSQCFHGQLAPSVGHFEKLSLKLFETFRNFTF